MIEIDEYSDYEKALSILKEAAKVLRAADNVSSDTLTRKALSSVEKKIESLSEMVLYISHCNTKSAEMAGDVLSAAQKLIAKIRAVQISLASSIMTFQRNCAKLICRTRSRLFKSEMCTQI